MLKKIALVFGVILILLLGVLAFNGAFQSTAVVPGTEGGYRLMGVYHRGPYEKIGEAFGIVGEAARKLGWKDSITKEMLASDRITVGVYFDDPSSKAKDSLLSFAAVQIFNSADSIAFVNRVKDAKYFEIPKGDAILCDQKTSGMISMIIAAMRAYPALGSFAEKNPPKEPITHVFEVYHPGRTRFVMLSESID
jgi:hypothetical protein